MSREPVTPRKGAVRCAIYTRKSSEEGLEQDFNSLDAQAEACAAYILSQASEGWTLLPERYDDGGISGGTLARPALQRLLADVAAGRVDIIVVYKVDRLTRSLLDFSRLVEAFDASGTSFVSVTQSFNTTTSMGRLTLNMLLSFAQFEREVTAERIRDKIAASKAKGMWMGGTPPLGYAPDGRSLVIVPDHAAIIQRVYTRYLALGSVRLLADELTRDHVRAPVRTTTKGTAFGGGAFSRGQLYSILRCPTYVGEVHHQGRIHQGLHTAIIDRATWDAVQARLADNRQGDHRRGGRAVVSPLAGKIVDIDGEPLIASHATKGAARYRYYVSRALHHGTSTSGLRVPAREIERLVTEQAVLLLGDPLALAASAWLDVPASDMAGFHARCRQLAESPGNARQLADLVSQVRLGDSQVEIHWATGTIAETLAVTQHPHAPATAVTRIDARLTRSGKVLRLVQAGAPSPEQPNAALVRLLAQAHRWWAELRCGEISLATLAAREQVTASYLTRVLRLAFLSPALTQAILAGRQPAGMDVRSLTLTGTVEASWLEQAGSAATAPAAALWPA
ncbi:recombinase family protein [Sphingomonas sp. KR1UV-12]|uniref:Recombinase family protein n=1 Tax=Sphingomonas aurea TaxID=3063994 RepID=A0ABT9EJA4_9SPHN|nr:recombinase family protein [Sphingomonas sp. KR1UV-12]MDP1027042.1 recombinase family protein [Sphingomonas sp. KR1UV-12]